MPDDPPAYIAYGGKGIGAYIDGEPWDNYVERLSSHLNACKIESPGQRRDILMSTVGADTYGLMKSLLGQDLPSTKTYDELVLLVKSHKNPTPPWQSERIKFLSRDRKKGESVMAYIAALKSLMATCKYTNAEYNNHLRDRLLHGCNDRDMQRQIIEVGENLTCAQAIEAALNCEARQSSLDLMNTGTEEQVHATYQQYRRREACWRCKGAHPADKCRFIHEKCHVCHEIGHLRRCCPKRQSQRPGTRDTHTPTQGQRPGSGRGRNGQSRGRGRGGDKMNSVENEHCCENNHCCEHFVECHGHCNNHVSFDVTNIDTNTDELNISHNEHVTTDEPESDNVEQDYSVNFAMNAVRGVVRPYMVEMKIEGKNVDMEIDTGASRSTVSESVYEEILSHIPLKPAKITLKSYTGNILPILGEIDVCVNYLGKSFKLKLLVIKGQCTALLGRDWLEGVQLDWKGVFNVGMNVITEMSLESVLKKYENVFVPNDKGITGLHARINVKENATPVYQKPRPVPYALVQEVDKEYDRLIEKKILYPVESSDWGTPVVCVQKSSGGVRICGDYKRVNETIANDRYKLPNVQDLLSRLTQGGRQPQYYSCLDLSGAFNQLTLDSDSAKYLVLNTHRGLLGTNRLTYGVKVAPAQFQAAMDKILSGIDNIFTYIDDILIATSDKEQHMKTLNLVLERLDKFNVKLNQQKCKFLLTEVKYLGHRLTAEGIQPLQNKIDAIVKAPKPRDVTELKSFIGMVNFYGKFIKNMSAELHPLYKLLQVKEKWHWGKEQNQAFEYAKRSVASADILTHYDPNKKIKLTVDASPYGVGAVISHVDEKEVERPIAFASRSLSPAEKNYAQIEREALAIIFGVKKFHLYLYGHSFILETDHKPLTHIFGSKDVPSTAAARMQRWALILSAYDFEIRYTRGQDNVQADMLSRLPVDRPDTADIDEHDIHKTIIDELPVVSAQIARATQRNPILSKVYEYILSGWPHCDPESEVEPYHRRRTELSLEEGCILWGRRVVIPEKFQDRMLEELHECHPGMCKMKAIARSYMWWPCIDEDIEDAVRHCTECAEAAQLPKKQPLLFWPWTSEPMQRIHADFFEIDKQMFHLIVDAHSKWMEVYIMENTSSKATIATFRKMISSYGLPDRIHTDNGPQYISEEFKAFIKQNGIQHSLSAPYHPSTNGQAEICVKTFKKMFKSTNASKSLDERVDHVLRSYRNMPHTTTGRTPAELFLRRSPTTKLSLLKPSLKSKIENKQAEDKRQRDGSKPMTRSYDLFQHVLVRHMRQGRERWIPGTIVQIKGPSSYIVRVPGNKHRFVHTDHLRHSDIRTDSESNDHDRRNKTEQLPTLPVTVPKQPAPIVTSNTDRESSDASEGVTPNPVMSPKQIVNPIGVTKSASTPVCKSPATRSKDYNVPTVTRSGRVVNPPKRLDV